MLGEHLFRLRRRPGALEDRARGSTAPDMDRGDVRSYPAEGHEPARGSGPGGELRRGPGIVFGHCD